MGEHGPLIGAWFWGLLTLMSVILIVTRWGQRTLLRLTHPNFLRTSFLVLVLLTPVYDALQWVKFRDLGYPRPDFLWFLDLVGVLGWLWLFRQRTRLDSKTATVFAAVFAITHRMVSILSLPLVSSRSDMMAAILQANERFFELGLPAYGASWDGVGQIPYLPLSWLSFFPSHILSIDPRWVGIFFWIATLLALFSGTRMFIARSQLGGIAPSLLMTFLLANPYFHFRHELYLDPWFFMVTVTVLSLGRARPWVSGVVTGLGCATLHWGWTLFPFFWGLASLRQNQGERWKALLSTVIASLIPFCLIMGHFAWHERQYFFSAIFLHQDRIHTGVNPGELCLGFASFFFQMGWERLLQPLQGVVLLSLGWIGLKQWWQVQPKNYQLTRDRIFLLMWAAGFGFNLLVPFLENYFMLTWTLLAIPVLDAVTSPEHHTPPQH